VARLSRGPAPTTELAKPFRWPSRPSSSTSMFSGSAGWSARRRRAGFGPYELSPNTLKAAEDWMAEQRALWERRLDQLDNFLNELKGQSE